MQVGVVFPQTEIGNDPAVIRHYAEAVEAMGYEHLLVFDHVLGADPDRPGGFRGPYTYQTPFHEPMVLFGYLAAVTQRLELVTGILILPQRETALVAKQAAEVDVLSRGRLRLGVGIGWNAVEYEALGQDFRRRGRRIEEQIRLLRALWTEELVTFEGRFDTVRAAGINPRPVDKPGRGRLIPLWMGGMADPVLERVGRLADGWFPQYRDPARLPEGLERVHEAARRAGRDPRDIGIEARVLASPTAEFDAVETARAFEQYGATHVSANTMGAGFGSVDEHLRALEDFVQRYRATAGAASREGAA